MNNNPKKKTIKIGYARVSTEDRQDLSLENQVDLLKKASCHYIYAEKASGTNDKRPEFLRALNHLHRLAQHNDYELYLVVFKNDRLSRKFRTLINTIDDLMELNIHYISLVDHIDTSTIGGRMFFQILSSFNEYEVANTRERVKIGLEKAKKDGKQLGRPKISKETHKKAIYLYQENRHSVQTIAEKLKISKKSVYNIINQSGISHRRNTKSSNEYETK